MSSFINTNMASLNTQNNLNKSQSALNTSIQRLSSGLRVNSAKDDAAGFAIASGMESKIKGQNVAVRNANDAISYSQTAEGALTQIGNNLQRMRELAVQSANGTNSSDDQTSLNTEFKQLSDEVNRIVGSTSFNGTKVLGNTGDGSGNITFQIGADNTASNQIAVSAINLTTSGTTNALDSVTNVSTNGTQADISSTTGAKSAIDAIDAALKQVNTDTIKEGANQNRFSAVITTLQTSTENQTAARSRIMDTDYASETATLARGQILQQAGMAMLAQANQLPNGVMSLLR